jgi:hypothetical protein
VKTGGNLKQNAWGCHRSCSSPGAAAARPKIVRNQPSRTWPEFMGICRESVPSEMHKPTSGPVHHEACNVGAAMLFPTKQEARDGATLAALLRAPIAPGCLPATRPMGPCSPVAKHRLPQSQLINPTEQRETSRPPASAATGASRLAALLRGSTRQLGHPRGVPRVRHWECPASDADAS